MPGEDFETHESGTFKMISETSLEISTAVGLLELARCPDEARGQDQGCVNGIIQSRDPSQDCADSEPYFRTEHCEWCALRKYFVEANKA